MYIWGLRNITPHTSLMQPSSQKASKGKATFPLKATIWSKRGQSPFASLWTTMSRIEPMALWSLGHHLPPTIMPSFPCEQVCSVQWRLFAGQGLALSSGLAIHW